MACMVSILHLISDSTVVFAQLLETVPNAPITIGIIITLMFQSFSAFKQSPTIYLSFRLFCFHSSQQERENPQDKFFISC